VGQGDSILLQFAGKNILVDGGEQDMGPRVESYLRDHRVSSLNLLVATHLHQDHIGGLIMIGSTSGTEVIRFKVEETLKELMRVKANLSKDDWRI
jgi:competence protein ComEC